MGAAALNWRRCGRGLLSFTFGWIRTQLSGATLLHRSAPTSTFKFSGARFPSRQMPPKFHPGCRIFILIHQKLKRFDPEFDWRGHAYFSSGAFGCRRDAIPFEKWLDAELWGRETPGLFGDFYEQPILNYLVHSMRQRGELKVAMSDLQHISEHHGVDELKQDCADGNWHFPKKVRRPRVAHFCGRKPFLFDRGSYSRPFTIARLEHHRRQHGELGAWLEVLSEERRVLSGKFQRRFQRAAIV